MYEMIFSLSGLPLELSLLIGEFGKRYRNMKNQTFCNLLETTFHLSIIFPNKKPYGLKMLTLGGKVVKGMQVEGA